MIGMLDAFALLSHEEMLQVDRTRLVTLNLRNKAKGVRILEENCSEEALCALRAGKRDEGKEQVQKSKDGTFKGPTMWTYKYGTC